MWYYIFDIFQNNIKIFISDNFINLIFYKKWKSLFTVFPPYGSLFEKFKYYSICFYHTVAQFLSFSDVFV